MCHKRGDRAPSAEMMYAGYDASLEQNIWKVKLESSKIIAQ
jgi:hypothetical protein